MRFIRLIILIYLLPVFVWSQQPSGDIGFYSPPSDLSQLPTIGNSKVKNIILFIGDGMGTTAVSAARIKANGNRGKLHMDRMPITGFLQTSSADRLITDSAAAGTALASGHKTNNGMIGVTPDTHKVVTILEAARDKGLATGLVATSTITHATPAAFAAHVPSRRDEATIAEHLLANRVNIILGGGRDFFLPKSHSDSKRKDDKNMIGEAISAGYDYIETREALKKSDHPYLLGLFQSSSLTTESPEPTLAEMTQQTIQILSKHKKGFFLMVEGSQIDWAGHDNNAAYSIRQTLLFDTAIGKALDFALQDLHTLVVVTADHETGSMAITGGSLDGEDIILDWATGNHTATAVPLYAFGPGAEHLAGFHDNTNVSKVFAELLGITDYPRLEN